MYYLTSNIITSGSKSSTPGTKYVKSWLYDPTTNEVVEVFCTFEKAALQGLRPDLKAIDKMFPKVSLSLGKRSGQYQVTGYTEIVE